MRINKKSQLIICLLIIGCFKLIAQDNILSDEIVISSVKIIIDEDEYVWREKNAKIEYISNTEHKKNQLSPETIATFTTLFPGKRMNLKSLNNEVNQTQLRLIASGLLYSAKVVIIPPRKNPDKRTILISVTRGFLYRFGGGNVFGVFGMDGWNGSRAGFRLYAGWNRNGGMIYHENVFNKKIILKETAFWNGPAPLIDKDITNIKCLSTIGFFINPDLRICTDVFTNFEIPLGLEKNTFEISPYLKWNKYFSKQIDTVGESRLNYYPEYSLFTHEVTGSVHFNFTQQFSLATLVSGGYSQINDHKIAFNLSSVTESISECISVLNRNIRSGYSIEELSTPWFLLSSIEFRWKCAVIPFSSIFRCDVQLFTFCDIGIVKNTFLNTINEVDAFGGGIRLLFDNPIFAYFTLSYGLNHDAESLIKFTATAGF